MILILERVAQDAGISRATVQNTFSKYGNPTLKTIAKIVHKATTIPKIQKDKAVKKSKDAVKEFISQRYTPIVHNILFKSQLSLLSFSFKDSLPFSQQASLLLLRPKLEIMAE